MPFATLARIATVLITITVLMGIAPLRGDAAHRSNQATIGVHHLQSSPTQPAIAYGGSPVIPNYFKVTIDVNGKVSSSGRALFSPLKANVALDLRALVKLAEAEGFFSMKGTISGKLRNVDNGPRFITIYTTAGAKTVTLEPTARDTRFDQLWEVLVGVTSAGRNCQTPEECVNPAP